MKPLSPLEDATLRIVLGHAHESDGWLDLTRVSSSTGRMLPDVRQAVARLARRNLLTIDTDASNSDRWVRFLVAGVPARAGATPPGAAAP